MPDNLAIADFITASHRVRDILRTQASLTNAEEQVIDSILHLLRTELAFRRSRRELTLFPTKSGNTNTADK